jgi:hypothetical protein
MLIIIIVLLNKLLKEQWGNVSLKQLYIDTYVAVIPGALCKSKHFGLVLWGNTVEAYTWKCCVHHYEIC